MRLVWQIVLGLVIAGCLVGGLQFCVAKSAAAAPAPPPTPRASTTAPPDLAAGGRDILELLDGETEVFHLAASAAELPFGCAPVLAILEGGPIRIPVAPPLAMRPGAIPWRRVGVVLPKARVVDLCASERSSLVAIWSRLSGPGAMTPDRVRVHGCRFAAGELEQLLRWLR